MKNQPSKIELPPREEPCQCHCHKYNHGLPDGQSCACVTNCLHCNPNYVPEAPVDAPNAPEPSKIEPPTVEVTKVEPEYPPRCGKCAKPKKDSPEEAPEGRCNCGRPLKFQNVKDLQEKIDAYFAKCDPHWTLVQEPQEIRDDKGKGTGQFEFVQKARLTEWEPYTITGLAVALETSRNVLLTYEDDNIHDEFSNAIKEAKQKIHAYAEQYLFKGKNQAGIIFNLKNNWNWKDKTESEVDLRSMGDKLQPGVIVLPPK